MGIRRRGVDSSFTLRNVINKTGVESVFKIYSPMVKEIRVVKRAEKVASKATGGLKDLRRGKVWYLREKPGLMERIAGALKASQPQQQKGSQRRR
jgi:large subunit ribosomal protein L19